MKKSVTCASVIVGLSLSIQAHSFTVSEKAGGCAGYHMFYAMLSNESGAMNDRDHSVRIVTKLDTSYAGNQKYTEYKNGAFEALTYALENRDFSVINVLLEHCSSVGMPGPTNTGR